MLRKRLRGRLPELGFAFCFLVGFLVFLFFVPKWTAEQTKEAGEILIVAIIVGAAGYGSLRTLMANKKQKRLDQWAKS
jgi:hypothetical protein